jgi:tRNA pseudouridine38-40 synthase
LRTFKIALSYDGTGFVGWQRQAEGTSIQGLIEDALRELDGRGVAVIGAGRTDAGVHALGQVASFSLDRAIDPAALLRAMNARLPPSVRVWSAQHMPDGFHARFGARAKTYRYRIYNGPLMTPFDRPYAWNVGSVLQVDAMADAARRLEGRHDFAAFQAAGSDVLTTERTVVSSRVMADAERPADAGTEWRVLPGGRLIVYEITADGFLRHMVRTIVGTLVEIGRGRRAAESIDSLLQGRDRTLSGATAPAQGLFLVRVEYGALADEP